MNTEDTLDLVRKLSEHRLRKDPTFRPRVIIAHRSKPAVRLRGGRMLTISEILNENRGGIPGIPTAVPGYE